MNERKGDYLKKNTRAYPDRYLLILMSENFYESESADSDECERIVSYSAFIMEIHILMPLVTDLFNVSEMRIIIDDKWNWLIFDQMLLGLLVKSVINVKSGKGPLNWSPNKICGKVFNEP